MQHSSALFVVFVMFVVLRGKKIRQKKDEPNSPLLKTGVLPILSFKPPTSRTPRTMPMDIGEIVFVVRRKPRNREHGQCGSLVIWASR